MDYTCRGLDVLCYSKCYTVGGLTTHKDLGGKRKTFQVIYCGRRGVLMVSALDSGASAPGSSPGRGQCVVFLGKARYSHSASLHPGV